MITPIEAQNISNKVVRKLTCHIMEELTESYKDEYDSENFELDYEYVRAIVTHNLVRLSVAKASSPVISPIYGAPRMGLN